MDALLGKGTAKSRFAKIRSAVRDHAVEGTASQKKKLWDVSPGAAAGSQVILIVNHGDDGGLSTPHSAALPPNVVVETVTDIAAEAFGFARACDVFADEARATSVTDEDAWQAHLKQWRSGAAARRTAKRIAGFEQLYELLDQQANLGGVVATPDAVQAVLRGLAAHDYADEVASAAAAAGWKMADRSKELCSQLLRGRAPALCVALLQQEALRREDLKKQRPNALRTAAKREAFVESLYSSEVQRQKTLENVAKEPSTKGRRASAFDVESALFCTKHALSGCRHVVGLLGALAARDDAAKRVVAESGTPWLLAASAGYGATERVATAATVLNVALASSSKARECLLKRDASFEDLLALLDSSTTRLNMLGAGAVATLLRERRHRRRVPPGLAAVAFAKLAKLAAWCAEQAREPSERGSSDSEADDDSKSLDSVVNPGGRGAVITPKTHRATELKKAGEARAVAAAATKAPPADAALKPRRGGQMQLWEHAAEKAEERSFDARAVIPLLQQVLFGLWAVTALLRERGPDALAALYAPPVATWVVADGERPRQRRRSSAAGRVDDARGAIDATWPETLLLVATFDHLDASFPAECAAAALAVATSWVGAGPALDAATVPPRAAVDKLCACVETSYSLEVRTACALALAHVTSAPSQSLATFQSSALDGDKRLVAVLGLEIGSAALDDAISAALFNVALHAAGVRKLRPVDTDEDREKRREEEAAAATRSHGLRRDCLGIWALARGDHDRKVLNYLGAPATLAQVLNSDVPLYTKEAAAAALWQLAGDAVGAATMGVSINNDVKSRTGGAATKEIARLSAAAAKLEAEVLSLETRVTNPAFQRNVSEAIFDEATRALRAKQEEATRVAQTLSDLNAKIDRNVESIAAVRADYEEQKSPVPALVRLVVAAYGEPLVACLLAAAHEPNPESGAADLPGAEDVYETMRRGFPADCVDDGVPDDKVRRASRGELALQICAVDLLFLLHDTDEGRAAIAASPDGDAALELLCCELLAHPRHYILRGVGAFRAAKLSATSTHRRLHLDNANAADDLDDGPDAATFPARDDDDSTQNMSFVEDFLSQWNEEDKVKQRDVEARFAQSILANLSKTAERSFQQPVSRLWDAPPIDHQVVHGVDLSPPKSKQLYPGGTPNFGAPFGSVASSSRPGTAPAESLRRSPGISPPERAAVLPAHDRRRARRRPLGPTVLRFRKDGDFGHVDRSAAMVSSPRVVHLDRCRVRFHAPPPKLQVPPAQVGVTDVAPQKLYSNVKKAEELNRKAEGAIAGMTAAKLTEEGYYTHDDDLGDDDATAKLEEFNKKAGRGPGARGPRLCKFDRTPGARVYSGLFQEYTFAHAPGEKTADVLTLGDGGESYEHCYLYYQSHVVAEASDPGVAVPPRAPGALGELWQAAPPTQPPAVPDGDSNPRSHNPLMDALPEMKRHALVLCASSGVYGGIPAEPMTVHVKQHAKAPEPEPEPEAAPEPEPEKPAWKLETSMFAPRLKEADSRQFLDAENVLAKALACDWRMVLAEDRFHKFVRKMDEGVKGGESIDDELEDIRKAFAGRYATVLRLFDYYCACSSILTKAAFSISQNSYNLMLQETGIPDETTACTFDECKKVFIVCNFEADKKSEQSDMNEDKALMRYEFIECLVRMAHARFKKDIDDVSECVDALFDDVVLRNVTPESILDTDDFRRDRLYFEEVEDGFKPHLKPLRIVYDKYAMLKPDGGRPSFSLMEWVTVLNDGRLIGDELTVREARLCFFWSRMVVADEVKSRHKFMTLSWVEFLEALARVADMTNVPTDEMVADCGAINMIDYEFKVQKMLPEEREKFSERRPSADLLAPKTRPLGNKVDKLCKSLLGYISCAHNGVIQHGGKRARRLIGTYITEAQFKEIM
ncbi:hypothetical protein JL722_3563 [Aureococcus anophagefferens]|nr:hypothetical protein JL722_3563 [Aureococcus anophagefferens]